MSAVDVLGLKLELIKMSWLTVLLSTVAVTEVGTVSNCSRAEGSKNRPPLYYASLNVKS